MHVLFIETLLANDDDNNLSSSDIKNSRSVFAFKIRATTIHSDRLAPPTLPIPVNGAIYLKYVPGTSKRSSLN